MIGSSHFRVVLVLVREVALKSLLPLRMLVFAAVVGDDYHLLVDDDHRKFSLSVAVAAGAEIAPFALVDMGDAG